MSAYEGGLLAAAGARMVLSVFGFVAPFVIAGDLLNTPWCLLFLLWSLVNGGVGAVLTARMVTLALITEW